MAYPDVVIIGAGITGVSSALELAEAGINVEVIERYNKPAAMASGWTLAGVRQSGRDTAELPLARSAIEIWKTLDERLEAKTGYIQSGNIRLARNTDEVGIIRNLVNRQKLEGLDIEFLEDNDIPLIVPSISREICAASHCPSDGQADPIATVNGYKNAAQRLGVKFTTGVAVEEIILQGNSKEANSGQSFHSLKTSAGKKFADTCILATGFQTNILLQGLKIEIPLTTPLVAAAQTTPLPSCLTPVVGVANADLAMKQQADGKIIFTSGAHKITTEVVEKDGEPIVFPPVDLFSELLSRVQAVLPEISNTRIERVWGGLIDLTADALPIIDFVPGISRLVVAAGFSGHGFGIGPATGKIIARMILNQKSEISIDPFRFSRPNLLKNTEKQTRRLMYG